MRKIISLFILVLFAASSYAQLNMLKLAGSNIDHGNYLLSHVPAYCRANLGVENSHLSVSTDVLNSGSTCSLLLNYSGSWEANLVENADWNPVDISSYDNLKLIVYAPVALSDNQIPSLVLVCTNDLLWDGKEMPLSNYLNPIPAGQWIEIDIPIVDLGATQLPANTGINLCCTGWPGESENPGKLYIDKIQLTSKGPSSVQDVSFKSAKPYYANGQICLNGYQGELNLSDLAGRSLYYTKKTTGDITVNLPQGVYFVRAEKGVTKIMIP